LLPCKFTLLILLFIFLPSASMILIESADAVESEIFELIPQAVDYEDIHHIMHFKMSFWFKFIL